MALTLTLGGSNFLPQYKTRSARITEQLYNQGNSMSLTINQKSGQTAPAPMQEIVFKDGTRFLFGGYITKLTPTETGKGQLISHQVECSDYSTILVNKIGTATYTNQTLGYIVNDLLSQFVAPGYGFTTVNVATGPTLSSFTVNYENLRTAFENLAKRTGYVWWFDYQKDLHFVDPSITTAAPEDLRDTGTNNESISITVDVTQVRNDIYVIGDQTGTIPALTHVSDDDSIAAIAAIEGGDGLKSYTINDSTISTIAEAEMRGQAELDARSNPTLSGTFVTRTGLLSAGSYFRPGQYLTVNLPTWGIVSDTRYVIQKVITTLEEGPSTVEYHYTVTFGGRLLGLTDFLLALTTGGDNTTNIVAFLERDKATITITESIAKATPQTDSATITIAETHTKDALGANTIPTWVLGPYFPASPADTKRVINLDRISAKLG